uniref:Uncharacterized protein n=1 Tax=Cacopsylla melanoneura TaxID=428564 RepID=A0A8D8R5P6_9HEMI
MKKNHIKKHLHFTYVFHTTPTFFLTSFLKCLLTKTFFICELLRAPRLSSNSENPFTIAKLRKSLSLFWSHDVNSSNAGFEVGIRTTSVKTNSFSQTDNVICVGLCQIVLL